MRICEETGETERPIFEIYPLLLPPPLCRYIRVHVVSSQAIKCCSQ